LATAALEARWKERRAELDAIFSAITPPLERLRKYCDNGYEFQRQIRSKYGRVLGCPLFALGAEICTQDDALRKKIEEILAYNRRYLESAIRDAHTTGAIDAPNPAAKAEMIQAYCEGLLTRARIENDVKLLRDAVRGVFAILGVAEKEKIAA
jgi:TetR/AcrR family transcriptional repressor of nem operon